MQEIRPTSQRDAMGTSTIATTSAPTVPPPSQDQSTKILPSTAIPSSTIATPALSVPIRASVAEIKSEAEGLVVTTTSSMTTSIPSKTVDVPKSVDPPSKISSGGPKDAKEKLSAALVPQEPPKALPTQHATARNGSAGVPPKDSGEATSKDDKVVPSVPLERKEVVSSTQSMPYRNQMRTQTYVHTPRVSQPMRQPSPSHGLHIYPPISHVPPMNYPSHQNPTFRPNIIPARPPVSNITGLPTGPPPPQARYPVPHQEHQRQLSLPGDSSGLPYTYQEESVSYSEDDYEYPEERYYSDEGPSSYQGGTSRPTRRGQGTLRISKWVNPIPPDPDDGQQQAGEQELATKMLQIQSKRFYIDVKQNRRGRFMKIAEIGADGRRNQVFQALSTAAEFRDHLSLFSDFYANLGPPNPDTLPEDGKLKSETMVKDNRRYYLDLKENSRGRFLRVSQTIARGGPRCQIAIPAQGMIEFRDALQELLDEFGTDDGGYKGELPEGRHMRVENKNFYFDIGQNNRGIYMRISEVKTNFRTAITIPEKSWSRFRDIFADYVDKMKDGGEKGPSESNK